MLQMRKQTVDNVIVPLQPILASNLPTIVEPKVGNMSQRCAGVSNMTRVTCQSVNKKSLQRAFDAPKAAMTHPNQNFPSSVANVP